MILGYFAAHNYDICRGCAHYRRKYCRGQARNKLTPSSCKRGNVLDENRRTNNT